MSNLARKLQQQQEQNQQTVKEPKKLEVKKLWFTPGEKILGLMFTALVCIGAVQIISTQAQIYEVNKEIQQTETAIVEQQKVNIDYEEQVSELSTYERIWEKAKKLGLVLNENNVKVVQE